MSFPNNDSMVSTGTDFGTDGDEWYAVSVQDEKL